MVPSGGGNNGGGGDVLGLERREEEGELWRRWVKREEKSSESEGMAAEREREERENVMEDYLFGLIEEEEQGLRLCFGILLASYYVLVCKCLCHFWLSFLQLVCYVNE